MKPDFETVTIATQPQKGFETIDRLLYNSDTRQSAEWNEDISVSRDNKTICWQTWILAKYQVIMLLQLRTFQISYREVQREICRLILELREM